VLTVGLLGAVVAHRDGLKLSVPAGKTTELLARLAIEAQRPVRADTILEDLWGVPTAGNTLQAKVSQLRNSLADRNVLRALDGAYLLDIEPDNVDAVRADTLAVAAERARLEGDPTAALDRARAGVALFRGDALTVAGAWATPHRVRLEETRWALVETLMSARVDLGAGAELVAQLEQLVDQQPLREGLWVALVTALYRAGRQGDALAAYARIRRRLADELGVDPGPQLRRLEVDVLRQRPELGDRSADRGVTRPGNVTAQTNPLIGRDHDVRALEQQLGRQRLVTLVGPAGVGKTRLALELAARATPPGGTWLIRLDAFDSSADLQQVIAETLRVSGGEAALRDRLDGAETLLVLDNCEHVVAWVAESVQRLLDQVGRVRLLATSQVPLGLEAEYAHVLAPLAPEDSRRLFEQHARRHRRTFVVEGHAEQVVAEVCARLDHLPLAIELAAARVRSLSLEQIARRLDDRFALLDDRFALLRDPGSHAAPRRRALETALTWSYELLFPDERRGLWALSCFASGATLPALEAVLGSLGVPAPALLDTISNLVDRSMVSLDVGAEAEPRYRLLDSVRIFAAARLAESGEAASAQRAHAEWYAERAAWCALHVRSPEQPVCVRFARDERADLDVAIAWAQSHQPATSVAIVLGMAWTWVVLGDGTAGASRIRHVLVDALPSREVAQARLVAVWLEASTGDLGLALDDLRLADDLAAELDDALLVADVHWNRAFVAIQQGDAAGACDESAAALERYRRLGSDWSIASGLLLAAYGALMAGDVAAARAHAAEAVVLLGPLGDGWGMIHGQGIVGQVALAENRLDEAARALEAAADASSSLGFDGQAALHRASVARCLARAGDPAAGAAFERALHDAAAVADGRLQATIRLQLARLLRSQGEVRRAAGLLHDNERWYAASGGGDLALLNQVEIAALERNRGGLESLLASAREAHDIECVVSALDALARLVADSDPSRARELLTEGDELIGAAPYLIHHTERYDAVAVRAALG